MKILLFANTDWYLFNFRLALAQSLRELGHELVLVSPPGKYSQRLEQAGFRWIGFPFSRRGTNPLAELVSVLRLSRLYQREAPDIVHHFTVKCVLYGSLAARLAKIQSVINAITGLGYLFIGTDSRAAALRGLVKGLYRVALAHTQVIFQNRDDQDLFLRLGLVSADQSVLVPGSGVDTARFTPSPEPDTGPLLVVLPARMLWDKGVGEFVDAARIIKKQVLAVGQEPGARKDSAAHPCQTSGIRNLAATRFALVGDSDPHNPAGVAEAQLRQWQAEGVVEWWGWREDMADVYAQVNLVCLPSYREGLPRTLVEAAACGRALVAADVPGCRSVVVPGETGLLVPVRDAGALAGALLQLLRDPVLRSHMGHNGRRLVEEQFSTAQVSKGTLQVYRRIGMSGV